MGLVALGLILLVSLILQHRGQAGFLGDLLVEGLRLAVGIGAWVFPFVLAAVGVMLIQGKEEHTRTNFASGAGLAFVLQNQTDQQDQPQRYQPHTNKVMGKAFVVARRARAALCVRFIRRSRARLTRRGFSGGWFDGHKVFFKVFFRVFFCVLMSIL